MPPDSVRAPRCCSVSGESPGGSTRPLLRTLPARSTVYRRCCAGRTNATTYTSPRVTSATGVLVIPLTGRIPPHGRVEASTGSARWRDQRRVPRTASNAYSVSFSVATSTSPPVTIGEAYTSPSSAAVVQSWVADWYVAAGPGATPVRARSPWYVGQSGTAASEGSGDEGACDAGDAGEPGPELVAQALSRIAARIAAARPAVMRARA